MWPLLFFCLFVCTNAWTTTTTTTTHPQIRTGAAPRHFSSCGHGTALFVANVEENDENMEITNAQELQRTLLNQNRPPQSLEKKTSSYRSSQKENGIDLETLEKLQAIAEQEEANQHRGQNDSDSDDDKQIKEKEEEDDDDDDFILLDGDEYLQSSQQMNPDGSLPELFLNSPQRRRRPQRGSVPEEMELIQQMAVNPNVASQYQSGDTEPTMQDLVEAMNNIQANNPEAQEALHSKVFENEQGYLQSSKLFQEGLMDPQKAQQAQAERRNRRYRQTMEKQSKELEAEIDEWQAILNQKLELEKQKRQQRQRQQQQSKENANTTKMKPIIEQLQERRRQEQQTFDEEMEEEWQQVLNQKLQKEQTLPQPQASSKSDAATSNSEATPPKQLQQTQRQQQQQQQQPPRPQPPRQTSSSDTSMGVTLEERKRLVQKQRSQQQQQQQQQRQSRPNSKPTTTDDILHQMIERKPMPYQDDHNDEQNTKANDETKGEWVLVDDPSSGEPFYWNSETGEMKWEIE